MKACIGRIRRDYIEVIQLDTVNRCGIPTRHAVTYEPSHWDERVFVVGFPLVLLIIVLAASALMLGWAPGWPL